MLHCHYVMYASCLGQIAIPLPSHGHLYVLCGKYCRYYYSIDVSVYVACVTLICSHTISTICIICCVHNKLVMSF